MDREFSGDLDFTLDVHVDLAHVVSKMVDVLSSYQRLAISTMEHNGFASVKIENSIISSLDFYIVNERCIDKERYQLLWNSSSFTISAHSKRGILVEKVYCAISSRRTRWRDLCDIYTVTTNNPGLIHESGTRKLFREKHLCKSDLSTYTSDFPSALLSKKDLFYKDYVKLSDRAMFNFNDIFDVCVRLISVLDAE